MTVVRTAQLVDEAVAAATAVLAFNVICLEHAEAIVAAASDRECPVIMQLSHNAVRFHDGNLEAVARAMYSLAADSTTRVALHLDHVENLALLRRAGAAGFSSAMFDGSALPFADNVALTQQAAVVAGWDGLWLEAELGYVGGKDVQLSAHDEGVRTDPAQAVDFVAATGVDALAVAVGNSHAMRAATASLDLDLIATLAAAVPVPLVLHGSSGVPDGDLSRAIAAGMTKVNIGTALNVAFTAAVRAQLATSETVDPRSYLAAGRAAMQARVVEYLDVVHEPGRAADGSFG